MTWASCRSQTVRENCILFTLSGWDGSRVFETESPARAELERGPPETIDAIVSLAPLHVAQKPIDASHDKQLKMREHDGAVFSAHKQMFVGGQSERSDHLALCLSAGRALHNRSKGVNIPRSCRPPGEITITGRPSAPCRTASRGSSGPQLWTGSNWSRFDSTALDSF